MSTTTAEMSNNSGTDHPTGSVVALAIVLIAAVACAGDGQSTEQASSAPTSARSTVTTESAAAGADTTPPTESTGPVDSVPTHVPLATTIAPSTTTDVDEAARNDRIQETSMEPIGPPIVPAESGTAAGETIELEWDGIVESTDLDAWAGPNLYVTTSPGGYLMMDLSAPDLGGPTEPRFWRSDDGIEWTSTESFTFEPSTTGDAGQADATYHKIGDDHWIVGFNAAHAWRSTDTVEWNPVIGPRSSEGGPRSDRFSGELYDAGGQALWIDRTGLAYWFSPDTETCIPDPDVVVPQRSASPATIDRRVVIAGERELSVSTPIGTTQVPLPWTSEVADIEGVGDSFVAYVGSRITECCFEFYTGRELTLEQIWTSTDGIDWDGPLVPEFLDGPSPALFISNDGVGAVLTRPENWTTSELWTTSDWRAWTETGVTPTPNDGDAVTFGSGALLLDQVGDRLWYSPDIETWHEVPLDEFGLDDGWRSDREYIATTDDLAYLVRSVAVYDESDEFAGYQTDVRIIHRPSPHRQDLV